VLDRAHGAGSEGAPLMLWRLGLSLLVLAAYPVVLWQLAGVTVLTTPVLIAAILLLGMVSALALVLTWQGRGS
jgi:hypothetical protein